MRYTAVYAVLITVCVISFIFGVSEGAMEVSTGDILRIIAEKLSGVRADGIADNVRAVVWEIRFPRVLCAMLTGAGLAASGVIFQGILQNPLADPYTLGISNGASFGAALAIYLNMTFGIYLPITVCALVSAVVTLAAVTAAAHRGASFESSNLIIAGIIVSAVLSSGVSFLKMLSGENVGAIVFWIMGSLSSSSWSDAALLAPVVTAASIISAMLSRRLDIMATGDRNAESLGVNTSRTRLIYLLLGSAMTAVCVSVSGVIGFVGLIVPHLLRMWLSSKNRVLLPASLLAGAVLLSAADNVTRMLPGGEIPVGIITTLIGGPFFIYIFMRRRG